jgi:hypothetical protein
VCLTAILVVLSLLAIAVICTAIGIGVGVSLTRSKSDQPSPSGLSSDTTVTQEQLQGEYYGTEGGIRFTSTVNATYAVLSITTTSGEHVVYIVHPLASNMTMMGVNDTDFLLMERDQQIAIGKQLPTLQSLSHSLYCCSFSSTMSTHTPLSSQRFIRQSSVEYNI